MNFLQIFALDSDEDEYEEEGEFEYVYEYAESGYELGTEEDIAATKIQRRFRKKMKLDHDKEEAAAAICIQRRFRRKLKKDHDKEEDKAAICIQRRFRNKLRKDHKKEEVKAATCIQRRFRMKLRKDHKKEEETAATCIQRRFRKKLRKVQDNRESDAATTIQRRFRNKLKKKNEKEAAVATEENEAARVIQQKFRKGHRKSSSHVKAKAKPKGKPFIKRNLSAASKELRGTSSYSRKRLSTAVEETSSREDVASGSRDIQNGTRSVPFAPRGSRVVDETKRRRRVEVNDVGVNTDASFAPEIDYTGLLNLISILALKEPNLATQIVPTLAKLEPKQERPTIERVDTRTITDPAEDVASVHSSPPPSVFEFFTADKDDASSDHEVGKSEESEESDCSVYDFSDAKRPTRTSVLSLKHGTEVPPAKASTQHFGSVMEDVDTDDSDGTEYKFAVGELVTVVPRRSGSRAAKSQLTAAEVHRSLSYTDAESSDAVTRHPEHVIINVHD